jgi:hypothetical protein
MRVPQRKRTADADLAGHAVETLPDRSAMSLVNLNAAVPINAALGLNVLSDGSTAAAGAQQTDPITQGI